MRDSSTRSFNAAPGGRGGYDRRRDNTKRNILTVAIMAVMVAIVVFTVLIFIEVFDCAGERDKGPELDGNTVFHGITFEDKLIASSDIHTGDLILINASFNYVFPDKAPTLTPCIENRTVHGKFQSGNPIYAYYTQSGITHCAKFAPHMLTAFNAMTDDFYRATENCDLFIYDEDGYRSYADQESKNAQNPTKYVPAGQTEHHLGTCVDLYGNLSSNQPIYKIDDPQYKSIYQWIYDNAYKYGFILRYPADKANITGITNENYHFRYVGYIHAYYMEKNGLCLEEYLDYIRDNHAKGTPLYVDGDNGNSYMIYYFAASSDNLTSIPVPAEGSEGVSYTISGDNKSGFIVTVERKAS